jgi:protein-disulfide isomerase
MALSPKLKIALIVFVSAVLFMAVLRNFIWDKTKVTVVTDFRHKGNPEAPIKILEYIDLQCPACAYGAQQIQKYIEQHPNKIYLEVKFYPLGGHMHSMTATKFAQCAGKQGKFWLFYDRVLLQQRKWSDLMDAQPAFVEIVKDIQLDVDKVVVCTGDDELRVKILEEKDAGTARGIKSTPTYFINDKMFVGVKSMMEEIDRILGIKTVPDPVK